MNVWLRRGSRPQDPEALSWKAVDDPSRIPAEACVIPARALAEEGKLEEGPLPQIPGPFLRAPLGTELRGTIRSALSWPHTERLVVIEAETVRWRVVARRDAR